MKVLVINHCSTNKGDKAVLEFVLHELTANGVKLISVSANEPSCCQALLRDGMPSVRYVPWGWNIQKNRNPGFVSRIIRRLKQVFYSLTYALIRHHLICGTRPWYLPFCCNRDFWRELQSADIVVSTGGHHITSILAPQAISPQTFEMALALLAGKPLFLWSQSIGPFEFETDDNRLFIKEILTRSVAIYTRDQRSLDELNYLGVPDNKIRQTYESVLGLSNLLDSLKKPSERSLLVGISVYSVQGRSVEEHAKYVNSLRDIVNHVIDLGHRVQFFPMQVKGEDADDRPCIEAVLNAVSTPDRCSVVNDFKSMLEHIMEVAKCRLFIGHKTHSVIMALITGTPLIAIAYHPKTIDFMQQFGLSANCLNDIVLNGPRLIEMFNKMQPEIDKIGAIQLSKSKSMGDIVRGDFQEMLGEKNPRWS
ncbi:MAG: polysaccharide pyruvyl transferase family protein [Pedobacter sp.]